MGCPQLLEACLLNVRPKVHLFGHNHDDPGCLRVKFNPNKLQPQNNNNTTSPTQTNNNNSSSAETMQQENNQHETEEEEEEEKLEIVFMNGAQACSWKPLVLHYHY